MNDGVFAKPDTNNWIKGLECDISPQRRSTQTPLAVLAESFAVIICVTLAVAEPWMLQIVKTPHASDIDDVIDQLAACAHGLSLAEAQVRKPRI